MGTRRRAGALEPALAGGRAVASPAHGVSGDPKQASARALDSQSRAARILARVEAIPEGFVRTYADIDPSAPRMVGAVLAGLERDDVPWHRVVRSNGSVAKGEEQLSRLRLEGVPIRRGRVELRLARLAPETY